MPAVTDPRVTVLAGRSGLVSDGVFIRVRTTDPVDAGAWCRAVYGAMNLCTDAEIWACEHPCVSGDAHVFEALLWSRGLSNEAALCATRVGHVALAATLHGHATVHAVEAAAVVSPAWFAESIRHASRTAYAWSAGTADAAGAMDVREYCHDDWHGRGWAMLHGWLATAVEHVGVMHPRALSAHACAAELFEAVSVKAAVRPDG